LKEKKSGIRRPLTPNIESLPEYHSIFGANAETPYRMVEVTRSKLTEQA